MEISTRLYTASYRNNADKKCIVLVGTLTRWRCVLQSLACLLYNAYVFKIYHVATPVRSTLLLSLSKKKQINYNQV